jgi:hypothetical protein
LFVDFVSAVDLENKSSNTNNHILRNSTLISRWIGTNNSCFLMEICILDQWTIDNRSIDQKWINYL